MNGLGIIKAFLVILIVIFCNMGFAQDKPASANYASTAAPAPEKKFATSGVFELGGSAGYSSFTEVTNGIASGSTISILNISPQLGYFVYNGLELGVNTGVSFMPGYWPSGVSFVSSGGGSTTILQLFATLAYNFKNKSETTFPFLEGQVGYTSVSESGNSNTDSGIGFAFRGGMKMVATSHFLINLAAQYSAINLSEPNSTARYGFDFFSISVGFSGYF